MTYNFVRVKKCLLVNMLSILFVIMVVNPIQFVKAGPLADYGDAPDDTLNPGNVYAYPGVVAKFPSFYDTTNTRIFGRRGPYHTSTKEEWLGPLNFSNPVSTTTKEADAKIVDLDEDDCGPQILFLPGVPPLRAFIFFNVSIAPGAPDVDRYVHVLVDQNRNGSWEGPVGYLSEVIAVNRRIRISPNSSRVVGIGFGLVNIAPLWTRIVLTRGPIDISVFIDIEGWDGSAPATGFGYGETEDWLLTPLEAPPCFKGLQVRQVPRPVVVPRCGWANFDVEIWVSSFHPYVDVWVGIGGATFVWGDPKAIPFVNGVSTVPWRPLIYFGPTRCPAFQWTAIPLVADFRPCSDHRGTGWFWIIDAWDPPGEEEYGPLWPLEEDGGIEQHPPVGGIIVPVDKFGLLAPYIALASTILVATAATAIYVKRVKRRKKKQ